MMCQCNPCYCNCCHVSPQGYLFRGSLPRIITLLTRCVSAGSLIQSGGIPVRPVATTNAPLIHRFSNLQTSTKQDSNLWPLPYQGSVLPTELLVLKVSYLKPILIYRFQIWKVIVPISGFEPETFSLWYWCSTGLNYIGLCI